MITQNLFNKRPKTFMDYEPGKVPSRNARTAQTTKSTQSEPLFSSVVKIVGDNVTEKDYEAFFEGFNSVNDTHPWREKQSRQEPKTQNPLYRSSFNEESKIQKLPYRPSVVGETRIQNLLYRPTQEGRAGINLYSAATPAYTQVKNTPTKAQETLLDKIKDHGDELLPYISPVAAVGKALEPEIKKIHYGRNQYNVDLPKNKEEARAKGWRTEIANCHQFTADDNKRYIKYISPDGKREVIFNSEGDVVIVADEDMGTYNYVSPDSGVAHLITDWLPWIIYGNTPKDTTKWYERLGASFDF